ncbi:MAG TPA: vitamin K epoxide reductase family protein [Bacteroidales bacterium]|nr:vitamin K epoxide reductase family protein [Bacteroidales bacterium]HQJ21596.1 vitamin K epoxide reductase family protein [Bacteroidales bacterium]
MRRAREDNTVSVVQRAIRHFRIPVTKSSVKEALKSNSYYPTLRSICDVLNEWKIEHYPLKYEPEEIRELPAPYIVHFNVGGGKLAFVSKTGDDIVTYYESYYSKRVAGYEEFLKKCSGAVILLNPDEKSGEKDYRVKFQSEIIDNVILPVSILTFLLFIILTIINKLIAGGLMYDKTAYFLLLTKTSGIALSTLLIFHEFEIQSALTNKLCHLNKATNCNTVLNDKASKIFGWFGWADAGFIYFTGGLLFLLQGSGSDYFSLLALLSALSLPYPVFSIYYQGVVLKKWCPMCLGVQLILILEFILLFPQFSDLNISFKSISDFIITFLLTGLIYILFITYIKEKQSNEINRYQYLSFKRNPAVLNALLSEQTFYDIPATETSLIFGRKEATLHVTAFLSLHCSHCARAFNKIKDLIKSGVDTNFNIILIAAEIDIMNALYYLKRNNKDDEALDLLYEWYNRDPYSKYKISDKYCIPELENIPETLKEENVRIFKECKVSGTPTFFINGYKLPAQYDITDIKYFIEFFVNNESTNIKREEIQKGIK